MTAIQNRYEFVYLFDIKNGNPNGDPDNGNMPRLEIDTQRGLVTDVCLKRKIRNYVDLMKGGKPPYAIYMQEKAILNNQHRRAYDALGLKPESKRMPKEEDRARELTAWMCTNFFDVRTFGAVMTTDVNAGQVRGPVQLGFSQSIDAIVPQEITITRSSVTNDRDANKERTMGRKYVVPYGLYRGHGFISPALAFDDKKGTRFSEDDLELLFEALLKMFEFDRSAARSEMNAQRLIIFKHSSSFGNAPSQSLFKLVTVERRPDVKIGRSFDDYTVEIDRANLPGGVEIIERL